MGNSDLTQKDGTRIFEIAPSRLAKFMGTVQEHRVLSFINNKLSQKGIQIEALGDTGMRVQLNLDTLNIKGLGNSDSNQHVLAISDNGSVAKSEFALNATIVRFINDASKFLLGGFGYMVIDINGNILHSEVGSMPIW